MKLSLIKEIANASDGLVCLRYTQKLDADALRHPKWIECKSYYTQKNDKMTKAVISIYNALLFHDRQIVCMTRDATLELIRKDQNHKTRISNKDWTNLLRILFEAKVITKISESKGKPWIVEVVDLELLKYLKKPSREDQLRECNNFINRKLDGLLDEQLDGVLSTKDAATKNVLASQIGDSIPEKENIMGIVNREMKKIRPENSPIKKEPPMLDWQRDETK